MVYQPKNVLLSLKGREIGFGGRIRQNILPHFAEEIAATSSTDNKACNLPGTLRCTFLVTFSHDHKLVASSHGNHTINISRLTTGDHIQTLTGHPRSPWCVTFHPSSNEILASGCLGGEVRVWDLQGSSEVWQSENHSMIASLSFHPRDQVLAIATQDQILLWDWRQPVPFASVSISSPLEKVRLVRFSPLGHNLLTGIANAPVDEEEPEYENLDVQHEAYQSTVRHARPGVPEHLNPYTRPRLDPTLQGTYPSVRLPTTQSLAAAQSRTPMSPVQSETLEDAREYAAAVTLTALGLRRVNPTQSLAHDYRYDRSRTGRQNLSSDQPDERESIFSRGARQAVVIHSNAEMQNDPAGARGQARRENGGRRGISSWDVGESSDDTRGDMRSSDDAVSEDSQSSDRTSNVSVEESRSFSAPVYVNMDVTNGDEIRIARTSLSILRQSNDTESHVARLQQLPLNTDNRTPEEFVSTSTQNTAATTQSDFDQRNLAAGSELRPLDLVSLKKYGILPSTSSQHELDSQDNATQSPGPSNSESKDCNSPETKRHCPDFNSQDQKQCVKDTNRDNNERSLSDPLSSSMGERAAKPGHTTHQRLSFSDAEVSSVVQNVELLPRGDGESLVAATTVSSHIVSSRSSQGASSQGASLQDTGSRVQSSFSEVAATDCDSEMLPALQTQTIIHPHAAVMHRDIGGIRDQPRAFTAHLGTIPHTAPTERTSESEDSSSLRRGTSQSSNDPHSLDISPVIDPISHSGTVSSPNTLSIASIPLPTSSTNYPSVQTRAFHFRSRSAINSGSSLNPLDLSIARSGTSSHPEVRSNISDSPLGERHLESSGNNLQDAFLIRTSEAPPNSQSGTRLELPVPSTTYQPCSVQGNRPQCESPVRSHHQTEFQATVPQGIDLSIPNVRQGTRPPYAPVLTSARTSGSVHASHMASSYTNRQQELATPSGPEPIPDLPTNLQPQNPFPVGDAASRYRRYNLWRSPGLRQRAGGMTQNSDPRDSESVTGDNQTDEPRGVVYGARRVAPLHTRRQLHLALLNQPSRQMTDIERMDMAVRVQRRLLRQSRQGPLRSQLGRLSGQFSGQFSRQYSGHHHHHPRNSIFDETYQPPPPMIHATINRAIANAFAGRGETAVANNIGNTTWRLQWWDFSEFELPDISDADHNVIVPHCKLHNDASCDVSQDSRYLAAFVPSPLGFPDDGVLAIYSLMPHNFGDMLYTKSFGPNAITVNISPLSGFVIVGLASRKLHLHMASKQLIGMIYKLHKEGASEDSLLYVCDVDHTCNDQERRHHVSVNTVKWIPLPGAGLVYGTDKGDLRICSPANFTAPDDPSTDQSYCSDYTPLDDCPRHDLVHRRRSYTYMYQEFGLRNLGLHAPSSTAPSSGGGASAPERRARGTQTPQRALFSTATQTDEQEQV